MSEIRNIIKPDISIVMPIFNSGKFLSGTLKSIRNQSFQSWECLLVDDGSSDESLEIAQKYESKDSRFKSISRPANHSKGASSCRNYGKSMASGRYIQFFDSDDLMHPNHLSNKMIALDDGVSDVAVCRLREIFNGGEKVRVNDIESESLPADLVSGKANWYVCGPIWPAKRINDVEFPEGISNLDDLVFNLRALRGIGKVTYINEPLIDYIRHGQGITGDYSNADAAEIESTIRARKLICRELKESGQYDLSVARGQLSSIVHLGYLACTSRRPVLIGSYLGLVLASAHPACAFKVMKLLASCLIWLGSGKGYVLVRRLKS